MAFVPDFSTDGNYALCVQGGASRASQAEVADGGVLLFISRRGKTCSAHPEAPSHLFRDDLRRLSKSTRLELRREDPGVIFL